MTYMYEQSDSDHIRTRIQELLSGGGGPEHADKKLTYFRRNYFTEMSNFKENNTFQSSRGGCPTKQLGKFKKNVTKV